MSPHPFNPNTHYRTTQLLNFQLKLGHCKPMNLCKTWVSSTDDRKFKFNSATRIHFHHFELHKFVNYLQNPYPKFIQEYQEISQERERELTLAIRMKKTNRGLPSSSILGIAGMLCGGWRYCDILPPFPFAWTTNNLGLWTDFWVINVVVLDEELKTACLKRASCSVAEIESLGVGIETWAFIDIPIFIIFIFSWVDGKPTPVSAATMEKKTHTHTLNLLGWREGGGNQPARCLMKILLSTFFVQYIGLTFYHTRGTINCI